MGVNLQVLAMQSVPRLAKKIGAKVSFPERALSVPLTPDEFRRLLDECGRIIDSFFNLYFSDKPFFTFGDCTIHLSVFLLIEFKIIIFILILILLIRLTSLGIFIKSG